jgi:ATP-dependent DNA helicase RecG
LEAAKIVVEEILNSDPDLQSADYIICKNYIQQLQGKSAWSKIS